MIYIIFVAVAFFASIIGAICGIGGGVIIKPVLDMVGILDVKTINFLSGCTVLAMSTYSIVMAKAAKESLVEWKTATPLAIGAAVGGLLGKEIFQTVSRSMGEKAGAVQAVCLIIMTVGTLIYTIKKDKIKTHQLTNIAVCVVVGLILGIASSFLGIGGGPINLVVLFFFFSMPTKTAAQNSLYIILFSQLASLCSTVVTKSVPDVSLWLLVLMIAGGIMGGFCGRKINKKIDSGTVDKLFIGLMMVIILINIYNVIKFTSL
ncbi:MAG: sulfite exporter TauE/SafE family protein [Lachnospiraceae bacterium]|nr:sulfite exporter TauE/SafE family protein [Candidatus Fimimorpha excrementavium]